MKTNSILIIIFGSLILVAILAFMLIGNKDKSDSTTPAPAPAPAPANASGTSVTGLIGTVMQIIGMFGGGDASKEGSQGTNYDASIYGGSVWS